MPLASEHETSEFRKLMLIGNSGAGKTGALAPLVAAGYELRIIDLDAGLDALINHVKEIDPKLLTKIQYQSYRDKIKMGPTGPKIVGSPKTYINTLAALEHWPDDDSDPAEWGKDKILVIDSLTNLGRAAFQWARAIHPLSVSGKQAEGRSWYFMAQNLLEDLIANVTSDAFKTNVIIISHIEMTDRNGIIKGYISAIGKALGPKLPVFFNTLLLSETKGTGKNIKRLIHTIPTALIDVKNPVPMRIEAEYPIETGLADIFRVLLGDDSPGSNVHKLRRLT